MLGEFLGRVAGVYTDRASQKLEERFLARSMNLCDIRIMDVNKDGMVSEAEFLSYMLVALQRVEKEDIQEIKDLFKGLDKSRNGFIDKEDLAQSMPSSHTLH